MELLETKFNEVEKYSKPSNKSYVAHVTFKNSKGERKKYSFAFNENFLED